MLRLQARVGRYRLEQHEELYVPKPASAGVGCADCCRTARPEQGGGLKACRVWLEPDVHV